MTRLLFPHPGVDPPAGSTARSAVEVPAQPIREGAGAICPGREKYEIRRRSWPSPLTARKTPHMESDVSESDGSPRKRRGTTPVGAECFPDKHRPNSRIPHPARLCGLHTRRRLLQCPTRLPERSPAQRAWRARTLRFTSSRSEERRGGEEGRS